MRVNKYCLLITLDIWHLSKLTQDWISNLNLPIPPSTTEILVKIYNDITNKIDPENTGLA